MVLFFQTGAYSDSRGLQGIRKEVQSSWKGAMVTQGDVATMCRLFSSPLHFLLQFYF